MLGVYLIVYIDKNFLCLWDRRYSSQIPSLE
jgi:hypothetical protein